MKKLSLIIMLLFSTILFAQTPEKMSYQAVIRDASGTLITNQTIGMQISILQGSATGTAVYQETQAPISNTNGLVSLEIGTGTVISGDFTNIDWSNDSYFIKTETDPAGGTNYAITGTNQLLSVPYALYAKTAANVSGLEQITENGNTGWRLVGINPANYGDIGSEAVDLSNSFVMSTTKGATGNMSTAMGHNTTANGNNSTAMGRKTTASGVNSTVMGYDTTASGDYSIAMGNNTTASGNYSTAMGLNTAASGFASTAMGYDIAASGKYATAIGIGARAETMYQTTIGSYNTIDSSSTPNTITPTSRLFVIGNGLNGFNRSDALIMLQNGNTTLNGNLNVEKVKAADSGDADMKAYVYGLAGADGTSSTVNTDGFVLTKTGTGVYRVTFNVYMDRTSYVAIATLHNTIGFINLIRHHGYVEIRTYNTSGNLSDKGFYFVVYKK